MASGRGSNAKAIIAYSQQRDACFEVRLILSNKKDAGVLILADDTGIRKEVFNKTDFYKNRSVLSRLEEEKIDLIVLAGFLWLIPAYLIAAFPKRIINIHPALLPKYGGKGMYGQYIHEAVKAHGETTSGITIHFVNESYDEGAIIFQAQCLLKESDTPADIGKRVLGLEHHFYPKVINGVSSRLDVR